MSSESKVLIVLMGLPSSGKSTIAELLAKELYSKYRFNCIVIGTDAIRIQIPYQHEQFDPSIEPFIKNLTLKNIRYCLGHNYIVINDDMNYYKSMRHELKEISEEFFAHFILIHIQIPLDTALEWNEKRGLPIPQDVIKRVFDRLDSPGDYQWDTPLITIQSDQLSPEQAVKEIISKMFPIISSPPKPKSSPLPSKPGINEKIDKLTRKIVAQFAQNERNPTLQKQISKFRVQYIKNLQNKELIIENLETDFTQKLQAFISQIKRTT